MSISNRKVYTKSVYLIENYICMKSLYLIEKSISIRKVYIRSLYLTEMFIRKVYI